MHASRRPGLSSLLAAAAPGCRLALADSLVDATLQLAGGTVGLLVLDLQLEPGQPLALIHLLARLAPACRIVVFSDTGSRLPIQPYRVHGWPAAPGVLNAALAGCRAAPAEALSA